jgi:hypothetical protein
MNPSDANSPIATLRQLKEMLDAGALTPQEFEALKQKLIFGADAVEPTAPVVPLVSATPASPPYPAYVAPTEASAPAASEMSPVPAPETPDWLAAVAPTLVDHSTPIAEEETVYDEGLEKRNPLNLIFAIGGALVFLAVVLYLTLGNRPTDEHLTSTTQTAADSARVAPEVGPQAEQLTLPPASPETIRVAPVVPAPVAPAANTFRTDSAATPAPAVAPTTPAKAAAKPVPNTTVVTDSAI